MFRTAIQLYTCRNVEEPLQTILERVAAVGFEGVEFAFRVPEENPDAIATTLEEVGLEVAGAHVPIERLEEELSETVSFYRTLGCTNLVIPSLDRTHFETYQNVTETGRRLTALADEVEDHGFHLHYHNHDHEFVSLDGETGFEAFIEATDSRVGIELDLGLALAAGMDPIDFLEWAGERVALAHLKDVNLAAGASVPVGQGNLDIDACAEAFRLIDGEWLIYEYTDGDPLPSLADVATTMRTLR